MHDMCDRVMMEFTNIFNDLMDVQNDREDDHMDKGQVGRSGGPL